MTLFRVAFPLIAASVDIFALYSLLAGNYRWLAIAYAAFGAVDLVLGIVAFRADRESLKPLWALPGHRASPTAE